MTSRTCVLRRARHTPWCWQPLTRLWSAGQTATLSRVMLGEPTKLESRFRLTYLMILSLLRVQELRVQDMMRRSFSEFASQADLPQQRMLVKQARKSLRALERIDCAICAPDLPAYYDANADVLALNRRLQETVLASPAGTKALVPGRLLVVTTPVGRARVQGSSKGGGPLTQRAPTDRAQCRGGGAADRHQRR
jgi:superfamily II RNA helicase